MKKIISFIMMVMFAANICIAEKGYAAGDGLITETEHELIIELINGTQWRFSKNADGTVGFETVSVDDGGTAVTVFDNGGSFILGGQYNNRAAAYDILENTSERAVVEFSGSGADNGIGFEWRCSFEAEGDSQWIKRRFEVTYNGNGTVTPDFTLKSSGSAMDYYLAGRRPNGQTQMVFSRVLPAVMAEINVGIPAQAVMIMNYENLSNIGNMANVVERAGNLYFGPSAVDSNVTAGVENVVESFIYVNNGKDSTYDEMLKFATDSYWELFDYPLERVCYPLTDAVSSWEVAAEELTRELLTGMEPEGKSDYQTEYVYISGDQGGFTSFPLSDMQLYYNSDVSPVEPLSSLNLSNGLMYYLKTVGDTDNYNKVKTLTDKTQNFLAGGELDGFWYQWIPSRINQGFEEQGDYNARSMWKLITPTVYEYLLYSVTNDETYRDNFERNINYIIQNYLQDTVDYTQPTAYVNPTYEMENTPHGGDKGVYGLDSGGGAAILSYVLLCAGEEFDNPEWKRIGLAYLDHAMELPHKQMFMQRTAPKTEAFGYAVRSAVKAYEELGMDQNYLEEADELVAQMLTMYYFNDYQFDNLGNNVPFSTAGMGLACATEDWEAFLESADGIWLNAPLLKYSDNKTLLKMMALSRSNLAWCFPVNDRNLGYNARNPENATSWVPYEYPLEMRETQMREEYGAGEVYMLYMLYEAFGRVSNDKILVISPTAVEEYQKSDHTFVFYNTTEEQQSGVFTLSNMESGNYDVYQNDVYIGSRSYDELSSGGVNIVLESDEIARYRFVLRDSQPSTVIENLQVEEHGANFVRLTWTGAEGAEYKIYRGDSADFEPTCSNMVGTTTANTFENKGLQPDSTYYYKITVSNTPEHAAFYSVDVKTEPRAEIPGVSGLETFTPQGVYNPDDVYIGLAWDKADDECVVNYKVYRGETADFEPTIDSFLDYSYKTKYYDTTAEQNKTYYYKVTAVDCYGNEGEDSAQVAAVLSAQSSYIGDEFDNATSWDQYGVFVYSDGIFMNIQGIEGYNHSRISRSFSFDIDENPYMKVKFDSQGQECRVVVTDCAGESFVVYEGASTGQTETFDIKSITGWQGDKEVTVYIYVNSGDGVLKLDWIRFMPFELDVNNSGAWQLYGAELSQTDGGAVLTATEDGAYAEIELTSKIFTDSSLSFNIGDVAGTYKICMVNNGAEKAIIDQTSENGSMINNIYDRTGWSDSGTFKLVVYLYGEDASVTINGISYINHYIDLFADMQKWSVKYAQMNVTGENVEITKSNPAVWDVDTDANITIEVNIDHTPFLEINTLSGYWALNIYYNNQETKVQRDTNLSGTFVYDLRDYYPDGGTKSIRFRLISVRAGEIAVFNRLVLKQNNDADTYEMVYVGTPDYEDVETHWARADILALGERNALGFAGNSYFQPDAQITRAEVAALTSSCFGMERAESKVIYADVPQDSPYYKEIYSVAANNVMNGVSGRFFPENPITRQEMAAVLCNIYESIKGGSSQTPSAAVQFADAEQISEWARDSVEAASAMGVMTGDENGNFNPQGFLTRAEAVRCEKALIDLLTAA